jgi:GH24 family phage-related lysozyme (muramidase)
LKWLSFKKGLEMAIIQKGMELTKHFEGLRLSAYRDPVGIWTIGWGHTGPDVFDGLRITLKQAEEILKDDLLEHEEFVEENIKVALNSGQFAALVSFAFNVGNGNFKSSTLRRKSNRGDYKGAANEFLRWVYGTVRGRKIKLPGLVRRRTQERNLFLGKPIQLGGTMLNVTTGPAVEPVSAAQALVSDYDSDFVAHIQSLGLRYFKPYEFLVMGHLHSNPDSPAFRLNTKPPREKWDKIVDTARALDRIRELIGSPITTSSVYRSPKYNKAVGGVKRSQHIEFTAVDFVAKGNSGPMEWARVARQLRQSGMFKGGIGIYSTFVHIDTRGKNADWTG